MVRRRAYTSLCAGLLFTVLGLLAWLTGQPFVFPSLGPSAFILAFDRRGERTRLVRVIGSHLIGAVAGLAAYWLLATGTVITRPRRRCRPQASGWPPAASCRSSRPVGG